MFNNFYNTELHGADFTEGHGVDGYMLFIFYSLRNLENENREIERQQKLYAELNMELFKTGDLKKAGTGIIPGVEEKRLAKLKKEKAEPEQIKLKHLEIEETRKKGKRAADVFSFADQGKLNMIDAETEKVQLLNLFRAKPAGNGEIQIEYGYNIAVVHALFILRTLATVTSSGT
ncbi:MAG: hypothetical protein LBG45_01605 [Dysgonamonadaceae bacterium]|nr:hypothetical protein [Dysgonamonadaceae bacterium]